MNEERKPATRKKKVAATTKKVTATTRKAPAEPKAKPAVSPLERWRMVAEAAYYRAQHRGFFGGNPVEDWLEAEKEIDAAYTLDYGKIMTILNPSEMMEHLNKAFSRHRFVGIDLDALVESQRKNVEALVAANRSAFEGTRDVAASQVELMRTLMQETTASLKQLSSAKSPKEAAAKQAELIKRALGKQMDTMREASETVAKANADALNNISTRVAESVKEIKALVATLKR